MPDPTAFGKIIGIYSSMPQQGKSTACQRLVEHHGYRHLPFARIIKRMAMTFLVECGYPEPIAADYINVNKEVPLERVPGMPTARYLMQTLGTQWGRHEVSPNLWVDEWECKARVWSRSGVPVVADDMRFPNEVEAIKRLGGKIWRIERPNTQFDPEVLRHASEGGLASLTFDRVINNDKGVKELYKKVDAAVSYRPDRKSRYNRGEG